MKEGEDPIILAGESGPFGEILVHETSGLYGEKGRFRTLRFADDDIQGAMDLNDPGRVVLAYQKAVIHLMEANDPSFESAFVIGLGTGAIAGRFPERRVTTAEVDPVVAELASRYFDCRLDRVKIGDGREILEQELPDRYDYVVLDAFNSSGTPRHLLTREFFGTAKEKLRERGVFLLNLMGKNGNDRRIAAVHTTLKQSYAYVKAFFLPESAGASEGNVVVAGSDRPIVYQLRHMAGFGELALDEGHLLSDDEFTSGPAREDRAPRERRRSFP